MKRSCVLSRRANQETESGLRQRTRNLQLNLCQEFPWTNAQALGDFDERVHARCLLATLQFSHVVVMQVSFLRKSLNAHSRPFAIFADRLTEYLAMFQLCRHGAQRKQER